MSGKLIGLIYFYLVSAASLALIVIGIFSGINYLINITQYDKYPLYYGSEQQCENMYPYYKGRPVPETAALDVPAPNSTPSAQEIEEARAQCKSQQEFDRKQRQVNDLKDTLAFTLIGVVLFAIHFPLARKHSK